MATRGRTGLLAAAWLVTAVAAGFLGAALLRPAPEIRFIDRPEGHAREAAPAPVAGSAARAPGPPPAGDLPGAGPSEEPSRAAQGGPSRGASASDPVALLVTVIRADGSLVRGGAVYALGAGEPGADESGEICVCDYADDAPVRLLLPKPGVYDVGYRSDLHAFATDVRVGPGETVALTLRVAGERPVRAEITGTWPPEGAPESFAALYLGPVDERGRRHYPGRGERPRLGASLVIRAGERAGETDPLPANETWRVVAGLQERLPTGLGDTEEQRATLQWVDSYRHGLVPDREVVRSGETVRLRVRSWPVVRFALDGTALGTGDGHVALDFHAGGAVQRGYVSLPHLLKPRRGVRWFRSDGGEYRLRWSGQGIATGEVAGVLPASGGFADVDIVLRPDPDGIPDPEPAAAAVAAGQAPPDFEPLEFVPEGLPAEDDNPCVAVGLVPSDEGGIQARADDASWTESDGSRALSVDGDWRLASTIRFVSGTDRASDPVTPPPAGPLRVVLRPAGLLCVIPDRVLPEGFGRLTVRLADGSPLPVHDGEPQEAVAVIPGTLLGPLPEGTYTFKVRLGGVSLPDAAATVKAGGVEVLRISTR